MNNMYRFSLIHFLKIFEKSLNFSNSIDNVAKKLEFAKFQLYSNIIDDFGMSLFKKDRLLFGLHIVRGVCPSLITVNEWSLLLGNYIS